MPLTYQNSQNFSLERILPEMMVDDMDMEGGDPILDALPIVYEDTAEIHWDQYENGYGLLQNRGIGSEPAIVQAPGFRNYRVRPGYYGERSILNEHEMTVSREPGSPNAPLDPVERITMMLQYESAKAVNRIRQISADFLRSGTFRTVSADGSSVHTDTIENYRVFSNGSSLASAAGAVLDWAANPTTAKPINDLAAMRNYLQLGTSSRFGEGSTIICQIGVINDLLATTQIQQTLKGQYGSNFIGLADLNTLLKQRGLPTLTPYDEGYYPTLADAVNRTVANFTRVMPVKSLIWIGTRRKGQRLGKFVFTRNMGNSPPAGVPSLHPEPNSGAVSKYQWAKGLYIHAEYINKAPFRYELDVLFNGGPVVHFGSMAAGISYT